MALPTICSLTLSNTFFSTAYNNTRSNIPFISIGGEHMKVVVVKPPKMVSSIFRIIFKIKKEPCEEE